MADNSNQPRSYDAVLGGQAQAPVGAMVLGGIEGVKRRLASDVVEQRVAALKDAPKYGSSGLDLAIAALNDESDLLQRGAYLLLRGRTEPKVKQALQKFNHDRFFECLRTVKGSANMAISPDGQAIAILRGKTIRVSNLEKDKLLYTIKLQKQPKAKPYFVLGSEVEILAGSISVSSNQVEVWYQEEPQDSLYGHEDKIAAIAISPDGETVASGSYDKTIKVWNMDTGKLLFTISNLLKFGTHTDAVVSLAFSPDGQTLASGSYDTTIKLWNMRNRELRRTLKGHTSGIKSMVISPDGQTLASGGWDRTIRLWHIGTGELAHLIEGHWDAVSCVAFSANGRILVSGSDDNTIKLWSSETGELIHTLEGHENSVTSLAISPDGHTLVSASEDKTIKVWGIL